MDYIDKKAGLERDYFTNRAQLFLINELMKKYLPKKQIKILSIGTGEGNELEILSNFGSVDVVDINKKAIDLIDKKKYRKAIIGDITKITIKEKYDLIVGFEVLEHIKEDRIAIKKINQTLKPDGIFILTVPAIQSLFSAHDKALKHCRRYGKKELKDKLKNFFDIKFISYRYFYIFLPVAFSKMMNKNTKPKIEAPKFSPFINYIAYSVLKFEYLGFKLGIRYPFGISLVAVCKKKDLSE